MIKMIFAFRDNPELSAEECERHYRSVHMGMAKEAFEHADGFIAIAYNRVVRYTVNDFNSPEARETKSDADAFLELWFEDRESFTRAMDQDILKDMFDDHANFMEVDTAASIRGYEVVEDVYAGRRLS
jgi:uncharacterized protein (TIGR02118 family)